MSDFEQFQQYFKEYQEQFGLNEYKVYFLEEVLKNAFATINVDQQSMVATVRWNKRLAPKDRPFKDIRRTAQHEALHLLIWRMENIATCRYLTDSEVFEASESLVHRLQDILNHAEAT